MLILHHLPLRRVSANEEQLNPIFKFRLKSQLIMSDTPSVAPIFALDQTSYLLPTRLRSSTAWKTMIVVMRSVTMIIGAGEFDVLIKHNRRPPSRLTLDPVLECNSILEPLIQYSLVEHNKKVALPNGLKLERTSTSYITSQTVDR